MFEKGPCKNSFLGFRGFRRSFARFYIVLVGEVFGPRHGCRRSFFGHWGLFGFEVSGLGAWVEGPALRGWEFGISGRGFGLRGGERGFRKSHAPGGRGGDPRR